VSRYEMLECDECGESELPENAVGWARTKSGLDLCPRCADARALEVPEPKRCPRCDQLPHDSDTLADNVDENACG
jgi:hypothetical protein